MRIRPSFFSKLFILLGLLSACTSVPEITPTQTQTPKAAPTLTMTPAPPPTAREIGSLGNGTAQDIAWTPDGQSLIVAGSNGLHFYDPLSGKLQKQVNTPTDPSYVYPDSLGIAQDGSKVIFTGTTGGIWQTDLAGGQTVQFLRDATYSGSHAFYSRDLKKVVFLRFTTTVDGFASFYNLLILDAQTGKTLFTLIESDTPKIYAVKLSPDGHTLAAARADNLIYLFNLETGESLGMLSGHESDVVDLDFSPDGKTLASVSPDASLRIWDLSSKQLLQTIRGFKEGPRAVVYSTDGNALYGLVLDGQIERWAVDAQGLASNSSVLFDSSNLIQRMALQPGGTYLALLGKSDHIQILDLKTGQILHTFLDFGGNIETLAWSQTGTLVAAATTSDYWQSAAIFVWDYQAHKLQRRFELKTGHVTDLAFSPDGETLAAVDSEGHLRFWNLTSTYDSPNTETIPNAPAKLAFSPDGQFLAVAGRTFQLWKLDRGESGNRVIHETKIAGTPLALAYSSDGKTIALATQQEVRTWNAISGEALSTWKTNSSDFQAAGLFWESGLGRVAFARGWENPGIPFYNLSDGASLYHLQFENNSSRSFAFSHDHRLFVSSMNPLTISDTTSGVLLWEGEKQRWEKVSFQPEGNLLATTGAGNILHLWDVSTIAQAVRRIPAATATVNPTPAQTLTPTPTQPAQLAMTALTPPAPQSGAIGRENLSRLVEQSQLGKGSLLGTTWAAGGRYFAVSTSLGMHVYALEPYREIAFAAVIPGPDWLFALSPAADKILTGDLWLWDTSTGQKISQLSLPKANSITPSDDAPTRLQFSSDGEWIFVDFYSGKTCTWKVDQSQATACRSNRIQGWDTVPLAISPDGQWAALRGTLNSVVLVNTLTRAVVHTFEYGENEVAPAIFSPDGQTLVFASYEVHRIYLVGSTTGKGRVEIWQISTDGKFALRYALEIGQWNGPTLAYTPDSARLIVLNGSGEVQFWDVGSGKLLTVATQAGDRLSVSPDGAWMLTGNEQERVDLWKIDSGHQPKLVQSLDGFSSWMNALSISSDGSLFSAGQGWGSKIQRWDLSAPGAVSPAQRFETVDQPFALSPDGSWLAAEAPNGVAQIIETSSGRVLASFPSALFSENSSNPYLVALALSQDKHWLATMGSDRKIRLWDTRSRQLLREMDEFWATHLVFSPDGRYLAASGGESSDGKTISHTEIAIWKVDSGEIIRDFDLVGSRIAFHPNGVQLVSARGDGQIQLLDLRTGQPVWVTTDPKSISSLAFSPDGSILATLYDKTIRFLDAKTGELLTEIPLTFASSSLAFSPDGKTLVIGANGTIRLFGIK